MELDVFVRGPSSGWGESIEAAGSLDGRRHVGMGPDGRGGVAHGESDEWSWRAARPHTGYDLHATVLHLLGIDHERLTFRHNGSDRRLTDVHGHVIKAILA